MRVAPPIALLAAGLAVTACTAAGADPATAPSAPTMTPTVTPTSSTATPSAATPPATSFRYPKRTDDELARSQYHHGTVTAKIWHNVTKADRYAVRVACSQPGERFSYEVTLNGKKFTSARFHCGQIMTTTMGQIAAGGRVEIMLVAMSVGHEAWAIVIPEPHD